MGEPRESLERGERWFREDRGWRIGGQRERQSCELGLEVHFGGCKLGLQLVVTVLEGLLRDLYLLHSRQNVLEEGAGVGHEGEKKRQ